MQTISPKIALESIINVHLEDCISKSRELHQFANNEFKSNKTRGALIGLIPYESILNTTFQLGLVYILSLQNYPEIQTLINTYDPTQFFVLVIVLDNKKCSIMKHVVVHVNDYQKVKHKNAIQNVVSQTSEEYKKQLHECAFCKITTLTLLLCANCKAIKYCSKNCQTLHWKQKHKKDCQAFTNLLKNNK